MDLIYLTRPTTSTFTMRTYDQCYSVLSKMFPSTSEDAQDGISIAGQRTIIKRLREKYPNPNTRKLYLTFIIMIKKMHGHIPNELIRELDKTKRKIIDHKEEKKIENKEILPSFSEINLWIQSITEPRKFVVNFLCFYNCLRNQDLNMKIVESPFVESSEENYLVLMKTRVKVIINKYKTSSTYGRKEWVHQDPKFFRMVRQLPTNTYLLPNKEGEQTPEDQLVYNVGKHLFPNLSAVDYCKIMVSSIVASGEDVHNKLSMVSARRGTNVEVLMSDYLL